MSRAHQTDKSQQHTEFHMSQLKSLVYTATVRPAMEYASTTWGTAAKTNKSRLDKVQNMALHVILWAMKTTPVHDMEKNSQSRTTWEEVSKSSSREKNWEGCLPTLTNLAQPTKYCLKRQSLNHQYKELSRKNQDTGCPNRAADRSCLEAW